MASRDLSSSALVLHSSGQRLSNRIAPSLVTEFEARASNDLSGILPIAKSNILSYWSLPGHGAKYFDCGEFGLMGCLNVFLHGRPRVDGLDYSNKVYVKHFRRSCMRAECPVCYEKWAAAAANRIVRRVKAYRSRFRSPIHVVVSPSQEVLDALGDLDHVKVFRELKTGCRTALAACGIIGGCLIFHPFREREDKSWFVSPHFHVLGFGWVSRTGDVFRESGYLVKNLGVRKSLFATAFYQLSHAGVYMEKPKLHTITWFGALSYAKLKLPKDDDRDLCPLCSGELVRLSWRGVGDPPLPLNVEGEYFLDAEGWGESVTYW